MRASAGVGLLAAAAITLGGSTPPSTFGAPAVSDRVGCEDHQQSCGQLAIRFADVPSTVAADEFMPISVVVTNTGLATASVPEGALLFRTSFSQDIGYGRFDAPSNYSCSLLAAPVTQIECTATAADAIAAGATRTFSFKVSVPSNTLHPSVAGRLKSTSVVNPDEVIDGTSESHERVVAATEVTPPVLTNILPGLNGALGVGGNPIGAARVSSLDCSGHAPFGVRFGSMTCEVLLHPADQQTGAMTFPAGTLVATFDVDNLAFDTLATDHRHFACSGTTFTRVSPDIHPVFKMLCKSTAPLVFGPGEKLNVVTWSAWVLPPGRFDEVDWGFCPFVNPVVLAGTPTNTCVVFGGSASSE